MSHHAGEAAHPAVQGVDIFNLSFESTIDENLTDDACLILYSFEIFVHHDDGGRVVHVAEGIRFYRHLCRLDLIEQADDVLIVVAIRIRLPGVYDVAPDFL